MIRVQLPYATFGLVVRDQRITEAAPIAGWTLGKRAREVWDYYVRKGADVTWLGE